MAGFAIALALGGCGLFPSFDKLTGAQRPRDASTDDAVVTDYGKGGKSSPGRCGFAESYLKATTPHRSAWFGASIAVDGNMMVVAAPLEKNPWPVEAGNTTPRQTCDTRHDILVPEIRNAGMVHAYDRVGSGWNELPVEFSAAVRSERSIVGDSLLPQGFMTAVLPTYSVALSGTWLAVGTAGDSTHGLFRGSVHVFQRSGGAWKERYLIEKAEVRP